MLYTERSLEQALKDGSFSLSPDDKLTPSARDLLRKRGVNLKAPKPEHMTHLKAGELVPKTHPRIRYRGKLDSLEALILLSMKNPYAPVEVLQEILDFCRQLMRCDVLGEEVPQILLYGMTEQELRHRSHNPRKYYDTAHILPDANDSQTLLSLNYLRTQVRETELESYEAFPKRTDIHRALNRLSSLLWILCLEERNKFGKGGPTWTGSSKRSQGDYSSN